MPLHPLPLPPANRAYGSPDPAGDMNSVINALNSRFGNEFYINDYGADPTGALLSDSAWNNCYADALTAVQSSGFKQAGAAIFFGPGWYQFSINTVQLTNANIGLYGQGKLATTIWSAGSNGDIVKIYGPANRAAATIMGFTVNGWFGGAGVTGIEYGDRENGCMIDVSVEGCSARGFWFHDHADLSEGCFFVLNADQNTVNYCFDAQGANALASFDWGHFYLRSVSSGIQNLPSTAMQVINGMHIYGGSLHLGGNINNQFASGALTHTVLQIGANGTDTAHIAASHFDLGMEAEVAATGITQEMVIQGAAGAGIKNCNGNMVFLDDGGAFTAGSITSPAIVTCAGYLAGHLFSTHGTLTTLGTSGALLDYSG